MGHFDNTANNSYQREVNIFAKSTGLGGALAIIRCSGAGCFSSLRPVLSNWKNIAKEPRTEAKLSWFIDPLSSKKIDQILVLRFSHGKSFTGEELVELHCHASSAVLQSIHKILVALDFKEALAGEFSFRAFRNGQIDINQADAINELIKSETGAQHQLAIARLENNTLKTFDKYRLELAQHLANIEIQLDYDESELDYDICTSHDIQNIITAINVQLRIFELQQAYSQSFNIVLVGPTNVGKSTLFNSLLRSDRALTSDIAGTTRDYLDSELILDSHKIKLFDTAGLRSSTDDLEVAGIAKTKALLEDAQLVLLLTDTDRGLDAQHESIKQNYLKDKAWLGIINKIDKKQALAFEFPNSYLKLAAAQQIGIDQLIAAIKKQLPELPVVQDLAIGIRENNTLLEIVKKLELVKKFLDEQLEFDMLAEHLRDVLNDFDYLIGSKIDSATIADIFSKFCVGK